MGVVQQLPLLCAVFSFRGLNSTRWIQSEKWKSSTTLVFTHESAKIFGNLFRKFEFIHVDFIHGVKRKVCKSQIRNLTFGGKLFSQILVKVSVIFSAQKSKFSWVEVNQNFVKIPESCIQHCARNIAHNGKSIGEGRATLLKIPKENRTWAKCFFWFLNY